MGLRGISFPLLFLLLAVIQVLAVKDEKLDPLKHREARDEVDLNARKEYYRKRLRDFNGCPPPQPPDPEQVLPTVPDSFTTDVEITFQEEDKKSVIYGQEMYDGVKKRGILNYQFAELMVEDRPALLNENIHYNVKRNEALFVVENDGCAVSGQEDCHSAKNCSAGTLDDLAEELENLFGVVAHTGHSGFYGASSILEFGPQFNYTLSMMDSCHGLECDVYETCIYVPEENATLLYTYYWSRTDWYLGNNDQQVPIAVEIFGDHQIDEHTTKDVMMRYDFFRYEREVRPSTDELELSPEVYCFGRKTELEPPKAAKIFFMHSEIITGADIPLHPGKNDSEYMRYRIIFPKTEYYDYTMQITRQDYIPFFAQDNQRRFENQTSLVYDFNQGLAYVIQPRQRICEITKIENVTFGDVVVNEDGSIFMRSPWSYEDLDQPLQYNGNHWTRGLDTDVWVGLKNQETDMETYVWYFASPLTHDIVGEANIKGERDVNIKIPTVDHVPVKFEKYLTYVPDLLPVTYNIYNFESEVPHVHIHDIGLCYTPDYMKDLSFSMPANTLNRTKYMLENLKYGLVVALSKVGVVSPLRINRLEVGEGPGAVQVNFTLLEKPDLIGDVESAGMENTLDQAYDAIKSTLDESQLIVEVNIGKLTGKPDIVKLVAMPNTMKNIQRDDDIVSSTDVYVGYSPGDMAALGISMAVIGAFLGVVGMKQADRS
ncbi:uncharacterized protein [Macrobrachium rosenbergii]|uniref:uncharacterized protein n=1 Tax=Macrobrachium rosenbergii TaxID=79674 RepID=UPI0034D6181F